MSSGGASTASLRREWASVVHPHLAGEYSGLAVEIKAGRVWRAGNRLHIHLRGAPLLAVTAVGESPLQALEGDVVAMFAGLGVEAAHATLDRRGQPPVPLAQSVYHPRDYSTDSVGRRTQRAQKSLDELLIRSEGTPHEDLAKASVRRLRVAAIGFEGVWFVTDDSILPAQVGRIPGLAAQLKIAAQAAANPNASAHVESDPELFRRLTAHEE